MFWPRALVPARLGCLKPPRLPVPTHIRVPFCTRAGPCPYTVLELPTDATDEQVQAAYRSLAKRCSRPASHGATPAAPAARRAARATHAASQATLEQAPCPGGRCATRRARHGRSRLPRRGLTRDRSAPWQVAPGHAVGVRGPLP